MNFKKENINTFLLLGVILFAVNINGIMFWTFMPGLGSGRLNPIIGPFTLILLFIIYLYGVQSSHIKIRNKTLLISFLGIVLSFIIVLLSALNQHGDLIKGLRDITYLWLMIFLFFMFFNSYRFYNPEKFVKHLIIWGLILFPLISYLLEYHTGISYGRERRFGSFMGSSPLFSTSCSLIFMIALFSKVGSKWKFIALITALFWLIESGTRTPIIVVIITLIYYYFSSLNYKMYKFKIYTSAAIILGISVVYLPIISEILTGYQTYESDHLRIFAFGDVTQETGSFASRLYWTITVFNQLSNNYFIGGYGGGAAEYILDALPHNDLLRYWHDYSIFYLLLLSYIIIYYGLFHERKRKNDFTSFMLSSLYILIVILLNVIHNIFQYPGAMMLLITFLYYHTKFENSLKHYH